MSVVLTNDNITKGLTMKNILIASPIAFLATFSLFVLMAFLIKSDQVFIQKADDYIPFDIHQTPQDSKAQERPRVLPKQPPKSIERPQTVVEPSNESNDSDIPFEQPPIEVTTTDQPTIGLGQQYKEATPVFQLAPKYPLKAQQQGIEGWVLLSFTIGKTGNVENIKIVESNPKRIFDKEAKKALKRWKYNPKIVEGKPVIQPNQRIQLDFKMD